MTLQPDDFVEFYQAVNDRPPFPWQRKLVERVLADSEMRWPAVLDLPTGSGKTSALDAAVFLLACETVLQPDGKTYRPKPLDERRAPLRIFFVVDRRIVVDEAGEKARRLAQLLNAAAPKDENDVVWRVAQRLRSFGGERALHVSVLRGGMYCDGSWAQSPTQPTICLSTVDQVGSRLLFRGYGVSPYQRAVHAGLVGNDALFLLDEAHLSQPFLETLQAVETLRSEAWTEAARRVKTPFQTVVMSATTAEPNEEHRNRPKPLVLTEEDREDPVLKARLQASKWARLEEVKRGAEDEAANRRAFARKLADFALELAWPPAAPIKGKRGDVASTSPAADVVGVVVNRVDLARQVFELLEAGRDADAPPFAAILLTGRCRPYDRDRLLEDWLKYIKADSDRPRLEHGKKLFVVATQTIECGADLSLDALVTEVAPLDSLRQRFGRLDRLGVRGRSEAVVVVRKDLLRKEDPVYRDRVRTAWNWLSEHASGKSKEKRIDFGIDAFDALLPQDPKERRTLLEPLSTLRAQAQVLTPAHLDDLAQTTIPPVPDPQVELFLHGPQSGPADVSIVWRADVSQEQLEKADDAFGRRRKELEQGLAETVALVPPTAMESLSAPIWVVKRWLEKAPAADVADLEGQAEPEPDAEEERRKAKSGESRPFLRWRGPDAAPAKPKGKRDKRSEGAEDDDGDGSQVDVKLRPGDVIVVPATYGGCDAFGWNPTSEAPVVDVADDCSWRARRRPVLRVHPGSMVHRSALKAWNLQAATVGVDLAEALAAAVQPDGEGTAASDEAIREFLKLHAKCSDDPAKAPPEWVAKAVRQKDEKEGVSPRGREIPYPDGAGRVLVLPLQKPEAEAAANDRRRGDRATDFLDEPEDDLPWDGDAESFLNGRVGLRKHCRDVDGTVASFLDVLGLESFREALRRAGLLHDAGKADPRFQEWLYGSEAEAAKNRFQLIAKSAEESRNAARMERARRAAGWPKHARHEALSVLLVQESPQALEGVSDPDLLLHLIGVHHGRGRPEWPIVDDDDLPSRAETPQRFECAIEEFTLAVDAPRGPDGAPEARPEAVLAPFHAGWTDRFRRMVAGYGWWGLAYLEALVVLADHHCSREEVESNP